MNEHDQFSNPDTLPPTLDRAFRSLGSDVIDIPPEIETAVLAAARPRLVALRRRRVLRQRITWVGVAAAAALAAWFVIAPSPELPRGYARMDIDGNGVVNVLDAFVLARDLETSPSSASRADFNNDGAVDREDVELVMAQAVSLSNRRGP